jgi:hypothetical protein
VKRCYVRRRLFKTSADYFSIGGKKKIYLESLQIFEKNLESLQTFEKTIFDFCALFIENEKEIERKIASIFVRKKISNAQSARRQSGE